MESDLDDEEGEDSLDDSEAAEGMAEMLGEGLFDAGSSDSDQDSEAEDYDSEEGESMMDEEGEDSFEERHGEPRFEVIEEKLNQAALEPSKKRKNSGSDKERELKSNTIAKENNGAAKKQNKKDKMRR